MLEITGKKAIVTGGAQGIGQAIVQLFTQAGAEVASIDIAEQVNDGSNENIYTIHGNLIDTNDLKRSFTESLNYLGGHVDILVNCAGIIERKPALELSIESWERILQLNVTSVFALSQLAATEMKKNHSGKIINFGSILSVIGGYHSVAYSTSKGAIAQLTKSLSNEWAADGIQVNAIAPGYMKTQMNTDLMNDTVRSRQVAARIPAKRWGTAEDVAKVALFLASDLSDYVTGTLIPVDGGVLGR